MKTFCYMSGEAVRKGDIVALAGKEGVVERVFLAGTEDAEAFSCFDTGGLLLNFEAFGLVVDSSPSENEDLELRGRAEAYG